jgi:hypothetical protein
MSLPDMNAWERRPDFIVVVQAVRCPVCNASPGNKCINLSLPGGTLAWDMPRTDPHQQRKYAGIMTYEAGAKTIEARP